MASKKNTIKKKDLKIIFLPCHYVYDEKFYGSEFYMAFSIADRIARRFTKSIVVTGKKNVIKKKKYKIIEVQPNKTIYNMAPAKNAILFTMRYSIAGIMLLAKDRFDIIHHVRPFKIGSTFNLLALLNFHRKTPFVIGSFCSPYSTRFVGEDTPRGMNKSFWDFIAKIIKPIIFSLSILTLKKANKVIVYDEHTKNLVAKFIDRNKIVIIPPGKDGKKYKIFRKKNKKVIKLISVGKFTPRKGFDTLIHVIAEVIKMNKNTKLVIIGDGPERVNIENLIHELNLDSYIKLIGHIPNIKIPKYYTNSDIFISFQKEESFANVYIEALASGLPIVTTKNVASESIVSKDVGFTLDNNDDIEKYSKVLYELMSSPKLVRDMSINARKRFMKNYDLDNVIIPKYLEVYKKVLNRKTSRN